MENKDVCGKACEVFSRIVGYFRPVQRWNDGKREEFKDRLEYTEENGLKNEFRVPAATVATMPLPAVAKPEAAAG